MGAVTEAIKKAAASKTASDAARWTLDPVRKALGRTWKNLRLLTFKEAKHGPKPSYAAKLQRQGESWADTLMLITGVTGVTAVGAWFVSLFAGTSKKLDTYAAVGAGVAVALIALYIVVNRRR